MTDEEIEKIIREYLPNVLHMSLATCVGSKPWVCEVHFVYDENLNLYFRSKKSRRHSLEIAKNSNVAGNIIEPHGITEKPRGVYFEGTAELLENPDDFVFKLFQDRLNLESKIIEDSKNEDGHKVYKVNVTNLYLFDSRQSTPSQKYHLSWGKI